MRIGKLTLTIVSCLVIAFMLLTACGTSDLKGQQGTEGAGTTAAPESSGDSATTAPEKKADPFGKYETPVEITACRILTSWMTFEEGENENNNWWTKTYLEQLGIKLNVVWTAPNWGPEYDQKIATSIATDDIPDMMPVYDKLARQLVDAGKTADITQAYNEYASPQIKETMSRLNGLPLKAVTVDGKMFGVGDPIDVIEPDPAYIWIRKDWLDKLKLSLPKTVAELEAVAKAFVEQDPDGNNKKDTYGIQCDKDISQYRETIFPLFGLRSKGWYDRDGKLVHVDTLPEIRDAWKVMANWYKAGILAKDFAIKRTDEELKADIASGKVGIFLGGTNVPGGGAQLAMKKNFPDVELVYVPISDFTLNGQPVQSVASSRVGNFCVVGYKCKNPEAVIKLVNLSTAIFSPEKPAFITDGTYDWTKNGHMNFWNALFSIGSMGRNYKAGLLAQDAIDGKIPAADLKFDAKNWYDKMNSWVTEGTKAKDFDVNWSFYSIYGKGGSEIWKQENAYKDIEKYFEYDRIWGPEPPTQVKNGTDWAEKFEELCIKAVMSGNVEQEFDNWIKYFQTNGGADAEKEANDWYAAHKDK